MPLLLRMNSLQVIFLGTCTDSMPRAQVCIKAEVQPLLYTYVYICHWLHVAYICIYIYTDIYVLLYMLLLLLTYIYIIVII